MSFDSWLHEFYNVDAQTLADKPTSDLALTQHALTKWTGFLPENAQKHDLTTEELKRQLRNCGFGINSHTCSLCQRYNDDCINYESRKTCPIIRYKESISGGAFSGESTDHHTCNQEYSEASSDFFDPENTESMRNLLENVVEWLKTQETDETE